MATKKVTLLGGHGPIAVGAPMSEEESGEINELEERVRGLTSVLGPEDEMHLHAVIPFFVGRELGGGPDIITFSDYSVLGTLYVTCELVGNEDQPANSDGQYELAVCQRKPEAWAVKLIQMLSYYTLETKLNHGETMDIGPAVPPGSDVAALLFKTLCRYNAFGSPATVLCCIGITRRELEFCVRHGSSRLFERMPPNYILTTSKRPDFI